ncbi:MAG TPA: DinB family protein [Thermoanaerobaculia bacterium]|nr:DinB family protein [Thermoanaerobaculia bacterium]
MFRKIEDFLHDWAEESIATERVMRNLTDASLARRVTEEGRSLGRVAWHIVLSLSELLQRIELPIDVMDPDTPVLTVAEEIANRYEAEAKKIRELVPQHWHDEDLLVEVNPYGEVWTRGDALSRMIKHEVHHRGQMTVLMRQEGLIVPGVYGPAQQEWSAYRMPAPE